MQHAREATPRARSPTTTSRSCSASSIRRRRGIGRGRGVKARRSSARCSCSRALARTRPIRRAARRCRRSAAAARDRRTKQSSSATRARRVLGRRGRRRRCREARAEPRQRGVGGDRRQRRSDPAVRLSHRRRSRRGRRGHVPRGQPALVLARHPRDPDPGRLQHAHPRARRRRDASTRRGARSPASASTRFVSIDEIARIEVIRGPVSSVYGANAFFGIINIVTRGAAETPRAWGRARDQLDQRRRSRARGSRRATCTASCAARSASMDRFGETLDTSPDVGSNLARRRLASFTASLVGIVRRLVRAGARVSHFRRDSPFAPYNGDPAVDAAVQRSTTRSCSSRAVTRASSSKRLTVSARGYANLYEFSDHIIQIGRRAVRRLRRRQDVRRRASRPLRAIVPNKLGITAGTEASYNQHRRAARTDGDGARDGRRSAARLQHRRRLHRGRRPADAVARLHRRACASTATRRSITGCRRAPRCSSPSPRTTASSSCTPRASATRARTRRSSTTTSSFAGDPTTARRDDPQLRGRGVGQAGRRACRRGSRAFYWDARDVVEQLPAPIRYATDCCSSRTSAASSRAASRPRRAIATARGWYGFGGATYAHVGMREDRRAPSRSATCRTRRRSPAAAGVSTPKLGGIAPRLDRAASTSASARRGPMSTPAPAARCAGVARREPRPSTCRTSTASI